MEKTGVEATRSKVQGVKMSRRNHRRRIKPMELELAMGLVGRPSHRINFIIVLECHRYNWSCVKVIMGVCNSKN
jgi:hypothetical protein